MAARMRLVRPTPASRHGGPALLAPPLPPSRVFQLSPAFSCSGPRDGPAMAPGSSRSGDLTLSPRASGLPPHDDIRTRNRGREHPWRVRSIEAHERVVYEEEVVHAFVLEPDVIRSLASFEGEDVENVLIRAVHPLTKFARPPISNFQVCAIGLGQSGRAYVGVNLEFPGLPLHHSVHAEQFMVANAAQHGESRIQCVVVSQPPCGHCRQFLQELRGAGDIKMYIVKQKRDSGASTRRADLDVPPIETDGSSTGTNIDAALHVEFHSLESFLPSRFGPHDLLEDDFPLLLEPRHNQLSLPHSTPFSSDLHRKLAEEALAAANKSYCPYTKSPSAVALLTQSGRIFCGFYMESAAFNPGLPPLQSALVSLVSQGLEYSDIVEAVLVEKKDAPVQFYPTTQIALGNISPSAILSQTFVVG